MSFLARVAWVRKTRDGYKAGFSLLDVKPEVGRLLQQLGQFGFVLPSEEADAHSLEGLPPELCRILEIDPHASDEEIFHAYRQIAMAFHPDRNAAGDAAERFQQAAEAYRKIKSIRPGLMRKTRSR
jgi:DnaJ-domain-containing protein 1